jgi:O-acetyl-ADP-ribose deacetylase (regulator of RNase III)
LQLAAENKVESISFPNISTGVYHFPKERAANIALTTVMDYLKSNPAIKEVIFVCFDQENYDIYDRLLNGTEGKLN